MNALPLILASTSRFRQELLSRLQIDFEAHAPKTDETPLPGENPHNLSLRLAQAKARSLSSKFPNALIIGSDQVATLNNTILGKPNRPERAWQMLRETSGKSMVFFTSVVLLNTQTDICHQHTDITRVQLRTISDEQIAHYPKQEPDSLFCAGAIKSEGLGMRWIERIESTDPNALIGLPMFRLIDFLNAEGVLE